MKQIIPCVLLICSLLVMAGCQVQEPVCTPIATEEPAQGQPTTVPTEPIPVTEPKREVKPEQTTAAPTLPPETKPVPTEPEVSEPQSEPSFVTEPPATKPPVTEPPATEPPATEPPVTEPPVTEPPATVPPETTVPPTEPPAAEENSLLDCQEAMDIGNSHGAASYGWVVDPSLNEGNAGFNFGSWVFPQDGQERLNAEAIGQVNFLYREMKKNYPDLDLSGIRFRVHAFLRQDGLYIVRVYYA